MVTAAPLPRQAAANSAATCYYKATYLSDVTIPDNTAVAAGTAFVKTWEVRNDGNCAWGPGTTVDALVFAGGSQMGSPAQQTLTVPIGPGGTANLSVTLTAPTTPGTYRSNWKLHRTDGAAFGVGSSGQTPLYTQIIVRTATGPQRINFARGATVWSVQSSITAPNRKEYVLRALAGQTMTVAVVSANNVANFAVTGVTDGQPYKRLENEDRYFSFTLPSTQDYLLAVATPLGTTQYVLSIAISPLP
jgi:hypothetical protein